MSTLTDVEIDAEMSNGNLIKNGDRGQLSGAFYELRMGNVYYDLTENDHPIRLNAGEEVLIKPGHRVVLITQEELIVPDEMVVRVVSKGSLFSIGLSAVATYADPGFSGRMGIVTQNVSDRYLLLPQGESIAKAEFTKLSGKVNRSYKGQHGYQTKIWPIQHHLKKTYAEVASHPRIGSANVEPYRPLSQAMTSGKAHVEFSALVARQIEADRRRGFAVDFKDDLGRLAQVEKDLVGLVGEVGEFANLLKKVGLAASHSNYSGPNLDEASDQLREELADALIYLIRLTVLLRGDVEGELLRKMELNEGRYSSLEK